MSRKEIGSLWDRVLRNALNDNFIELYAKSQKAGEDSSDALERLILTTSTANDAKRIAEMTRTELDNLVLSVGDSGPEIVAARGLFDTLGGRLGDSDSKINTITTLVNSNKNKLSNIEDGAEKNEVISVNGLKGKVLIPSPDFTNYYNKVEVDGLIQDIDTEVGSTPGVDGKDGINGVDGIDGENGSDGIDGENGSDGIDGENGSDGIDGENGSDGENGLSAYELAVIEGFDGTVGEWIESLKGADGVGGVSSVNGEVGDVVIEDLVVDLSEYDLTSEAVVREGLIKDYVDDNYYDKDDIDGLISEGGAGDGSPGLSAYDIAVEDGFVGSISDWLLSLKGDDGLSAYEIAVRGGDVSQYLTMGSGNLLATDEVKDYYDKEELDVIFKNYDDSIDTLYEYINILESKLK